jgi:ribosome assembly protein 4
MATVLPPPSKRQKLVADNDKLILEEQAKIPEGLGSVRVQFVDQATGQPTAGAISIPIAQATTKNLESLLNTLQNQDDENAEKVPYRFTFLSDKKEVAAGEEQDQRIIDITNSLYHSVLKPSLKTTEDLITLHFTPLSVFRVRAVTRCSASISGHGSAILTTAFNPANSSRMASGSGDNTARIWDCDTGTPFTTLKGHTGWVLAVSYSPDGSLLATGSYDRTVRIWDAKTGKPFGGSTSSETTASSKIKKDTSDGVVLKGHTGYITSLAWEPYHLQAPNRPRLASASKDGSVRVWDVTSGRTDYVLSGHTSTVSCVRWGGHAGPGGEAGTLYTSSHDKTVKVWVAGTEGRCIRTLSAHAHWVNHIALSTEHVLRTAFHDPAPNAQLPATASTEQKREFARRRYDQAATMA